MKRWLLGVVLFAAPFMAVAQVPQNRFTAALAQGNARIKVTPKEAEQRVDIEIDGKPFTSYVWGGVQRPCLFPIYSPKQNLITRGYPLSPRPNERTDFSNQSGLWMAFGNVNGIDFWNNAQNPGLGEKRPYGSIRHKSIKKATSGKAIGQLEVESEWVGPKGDVILTQTTLYQFEGAGADRTITVTTTLTGKQDAVFMDDRDGFVGLRLARELEHKYKEGAQLTGADGKPQTALSNGGTPTGEYINSESIKLDSIFGKRAEWVLLNGQIGSEPLTVAFLDFPKNLGHPAYWNARGTGLFAVNPLGQAIYSRGVEDLNMRIPKGESLIFKHRLRIQSGRQLTEADCEKLFTQFSAGDEE